MQTTPGVPCSIHVRYEGRDEPAAGLEPQAADPTTGVVTWRWIIDPGAPPGNRLVAVECGDLAHPTRVVVGPNR